MGSRVIPRVGRVYIKIKLSGPICSPFFEFSISAFLGPCGYGVDYVHVDRLHKLNTTLLSPPMPKPPLAPPITTTMSTKV